MILGVLFLDFLLGLSNYHKPLSKFSHFYEWFFKVSAVFAMNDDAKWGLALTDQPHS